MQKQYQPGKYQPRPENEGKNALDPYGQHPLPLKNHSMRSQALSPSVLWASFVILAVICVKVFAQDRIFTF